MFSALSAMKRNEGDKDDDSFDDAARRLTVACLGRARAASPSDASARLNRKGTTSDEEMMRQMEEENKGNGGGGMSAESLFKEVGSLRTRVR